MIDQETKLLEFYNQCIEKDYIDMSDDVQALKAKVIATDLNLNYKDISILFKDAETLKKRKEYEHAKLMVDGNLILKIKASKHNVSVFRREDGSLYHEHKKQRKEGIPEILLLRGGSLTYDYHPSKTIYTGASSGGIHMGGFHQTKSYVSQHVQGSSTGYLKLAEYEDAIIDSFSVTKEEIEHFKRDVRYHAYCRSTSDKFVKIDAYSPEGKKKGLEDAQMTIKYNVGNIYSRMSAVVNVNLKMIKKWKIKMYILFHSVVSGAFQKDTFFLQPVCCLNKPSRSRGIRRFKVPNLD